MRKILSLLMVILWQGSLLESPNDPFRESHDFRIVQIDKDVVIERRLENIDTEGVITHYWYTVGGGEEEVLKAAVLDMAQRLHSSEGTK